MAFAMCAEGCAFYDQQETQELDEYFSKTNKDGCNIQWFLLLCGCILKLLCLGCIVEHEHTTRFWVFIAIYVLSEVLHGIGIFMPLFTNSDTYFPSVSYRLGWFSNVWFGVFFAAPYFFLFGFVGG